MPAAEPDITRDTPPTVRAQRERVKASQDMAASVANELRPPVFAITSAVQLLRYRVKDDPVIEKNVGRILREVERLNAIVASLLDYGSPAPVQLVPSDPDEMWTSVLEAHRGMLESKAIVAQHSAAVPRAMCGVDAEQFAEACAAALVAAVSLAGEGSDLAITSATGADGAWLSAVRIGHAPLDAAAIRRAFEPLGSIPSDHSGVNLAAADRILADHGGSVTLRSGSDAATTITLALPPYHG